jgi:hypothetical protein
MGSNTDNFGEYALTRSLSYEAEEDRFVNCDIYSKTDMNRLPNFYVLRQLHQHALRSRASLYYK